MGKVRKEVDPYEENILIEMRIVSHQHFGKYVSVRDSSAYVASNGGRNAITRERALELL